MQVDLNTGNLHFSWMDFYLIKMLSEGYPRIGDYIDLISIECAHI